MEYRGNTKVIPAGSIYQPVLKLRGNKRRSWSYQNLNAAKLGCSPPWKGLGGVAIGVLEPRHGSASSSAGGTRQGSRSDGISLDWKLTTTSKGKGHC